MAGRRTSIYLTEELEAAVKASGLPIVELIRRGLGIAASDRAVKVSSPSLGPCGSCGDM